MREVPRGERGKKGGGSTMRGKIWLHGERRDWRWLHGERRDWRWLHGQENDKSSGKFPQISQELLQSGHRQI
jgi:hypothetical protein